MSVDAPSHPYLDAGGEFRAGTARWWGEVVIGVDAIYLLQSRPARGRSFLALFELLADRLLPSRTLPVIDYAEIPDVVRGDAAWPTRHASYSGALVVPKPEVAFLYHQPGKLETRFIFRGIEIAIPHGRFGGKRIREFAEAAGWPMFWDGAPINLPGRSKQQLLCEVDAMPFTRPVVSYAAIATGFVLAVAPMLLELAPRMNRDLVSTLWLSGWIGGVALVLFGWVALRRGH